MKYLPYRSVGDLNFGAMLNESIALLGNPIGSQERADGVTELDYGSAVYRFDANRGFYECTGAWDVLEITNIIVRHQELYDFLKTNDLNCKDHLGFLISYQFGIAHEYEQMWTSLFREGLWDQFIEV